MTAQRWWVKWFARQLARLDGASGQVRLFSLALTAFSTFSIMLQGFGLGHLVPYVGVGGAVLGWIYIYLYTEGGVWNQMARDRQDMSGNWAGPNMRMVAELYARGKLAGEKGQPLTDGERDAVEEELDAAFDELRDGINIDSYDD